MMVRIGASTRLATCVLAGTLVGRLATGTAQAGPLAADGVVKWMADADGQFFFVDATGNNAWDGQAGGGGKFRIEGGAQTGRLLPGDFNGNGQDQLGILTDTKYFIDDGGFSWTPGGGNESSGFFAPNVGNLQALNQDWNADNADDFGQVGTDQFIYVDENGNKAWDGDPNDAKFRIEGGSLTGVVFSGDFGSVPQIGLFTATKVYLDDGDCSWAPLGGGDVSFFFAPNVGNVDAVLIGDFNSSGSDNIAKIAGGFIYMDLNGNMVWDGQSGGDGKFRIEGGTLNGPYFTGDLTGTAAGDQAGQFSTTKAFVDKDGDASWTPAGDEELSFFFAPNVGNIQAAGVGSWSAP